MKITSLDIPDIKLVEPKYHRDDRGFFSEVFRSDVFSDAGIDTNLVQENQSFSRAAGVVRGLHLQTNPHAQGKLVRVVGGSIFDVALDVRHGSPTFGQHVSAVLSAANGTQLWIPRGFAHGFCTLEPDTEVIYKVTDYYAPECDRSIRWNDPALKIAWPVSSTDVILSAKDAAALMFAEHPAYFFF